MGNNLSSGSTLKINSLYFAARGQMFCNAGRCECNHGDLTWVASYEEMLPGYTVGRCVHKNGTGFTNISRVTISMANLKKYKVTMSKVDINCSIQNKAFDCIFQNHH